MTTPGPARHSPPVPKSATRGLREKPAIPSFAHPQLTPLPQWVNWRLESRDGKPTKVPYDPRTGKRANSTDSSTWGTYADAISAMADFDGVGIVLSDGDSLTAIDLDNVRDPNTGEIEPWGKAIIGRLNSYAEVSPSGTGVHVFVLGKLPPGSRCRRQFETGLIEIYSRERYLTYTGKHLDETPLRIEQRQAEIDAIHRELFANQRPRGAAEPIRVAPVAASDEELLERIRASKEGPKFLRLMNGDISDYDGDHSAADLAYCNNLAFWLGKDRKRMDAWFRRSGLMRNKWDERHGASSYGVLTIERACADVREIYKSPRNRKSDTGDSAGTPEALNDDAAVIQMSGRRPRPSPSEPDPFGSVAPYPAPITPEGHYGIAGEFVRLVEPHTEADPNLLLISFLVYAGNVIGRNPHVWASGVTHHTNLFACGVGPTSTGRKGTARAPVDMFFRDIDEEWAKSIQSGGLSTGEGLISYVRDPLVRREKVSEKGKPMVFEDVEVDPGVADKRLLIYQPEFFTTLQVMRRDGNTLSPTIRQAWESGDLSSMTKNSPTRATGAHISVIANITRDELMRGLTATDSSNGFTNRFLWCCSVRSKLLPEGGALQNVDFAKLRNRFELAWFEARNRGAMYRDEAASDLWGRDGSPENGMYNELTRDRHGMFGGATGRAAPQVLRLSLIYALLDCALEIRQEHLLAAYAVWRYCEDSARYIFGDSLGNPVANEILRKLRQTPKGLTRTEIRDLFKQNKSTQAINEALLLLHKTGLARFEMQPTAGRSTERWFALAGFSRDRAGKVA